MVVVFILENAEPIMDFKTGIRCQSSVLVEAGNMQEAYEKLAKHQSDNGNRSIGPADVESGEISVLFPSRA